jgi:enediyne biosynthesis protein E4
LWSLFAVQLFLDLLSRRGAAFGDINNDGNVDIVVANAGAPPSLLMNRHESANHRVLFKLIGTKSNKAAIGARVTVKAGALTQFDEVRGGASYISQNDLRMHFGLAANGKTQEVTIRWPNGQTETLRDVAADFIYTMARERRHPPKSGFACFAMTSPDFLNQVF